MKKLIVFISCTLLGSGVWAAAAQLRVTLYEEGYFRIVINGRQMGVSRNTAILNHLPPGRHRVEVYEVRRHRQGIFSRNRERLYYRGSLVLRPYTHTEIRVNRFGRAEVRQMQSVRQDPRRIKMQPVPLPPRGRRW